MDRQEPYGSFAAYLPESGDSEETARRSATETLSAETECRCIDICAEFGTSNPRKCLVFLKLRDGPAARNVQGLTDRDTEIFLGALFALAPKPQRGHSVSLFL